MIRIKDLKIPLTYDMKVLEEIAAKRLGIENNRIERISIVKRSVNVLDRKSTRLNSSHH